MKLHALKQDTRGMTLIEIMTGFAILAILLLVSLSIMLFSGHVFTDDSSRDRLKMTGDEMYQAISQQLIFVTHIQLLPAGTAPATAQYDSVLFVQDGKLYQGPKNGPYTPCYADDVYQRTTLSITASATGEDVLTLQFCYTKDGQTAYQTGSSLRLINLSAATDPVILETPGGEQVNPLISYDTVPYQIEEAYHPIVVDQTPYTVQNYADGQPIKAFTAGNTYYKGDIIEFEGTLWQLTVDELIYTGQKDEQPGHPHTPIWRSLAEDWHTVNSGNSGKSIYYYPDVVKCEGNYYLCTYEEPFYNVKNPATLQGWMQVYWFADKQTPQNRLLGWSSTQQEYTSILK